MSLMIQLKIVISNIDEVNVYVFFWCCNDNCSKSNVFFV